MLERSMDDMPGLLFYDMLTNGRYGAGDFVQAANVSWVDLYPLAQYANSLLPPLTVRKNLGLLVIRSLAEAEAFNVLQDLASVFRGMLYWQANTIQADSRSWQLN